MSPRLRGKAEGPPSYGHDNSASFTIELHHGGFFVGFGSLRSYVDEKVNWFDWIDSDVWSALWFEDFFVQLGYDSVEKIKFHWLLPGIDFPEGLRVIQSDADTNAMVSVVHKVKNLVVYADHEDSMNTVDWDDVVANPANELPTVFSPQKVVYVDRNPTEKLPVFYTDLKKGRVEQQAGSSKEPDDASEYEQQDFYDSDYEISDGDEDLYEDVVEMTVPKVTKNKKAKGSQLKGKEIIASTTVNDDADTEDDCLDLPDSDGDGEDRLRFNSWNPEDMINPSFSVGLVFPSVESVRQAITEYSVRNRVEIKLPRNDKKRVKAHCAEGCPWNLYASWDSRVKSFVVKTYYGTHNCQKEWVLRRCTSRWLADKYIDSFRANEKMSITGFGRVIQKDWNLTPSRSKVARARRLIMRVIYGDEIKQYDCLWDYAQEIRRSNPGSSLYLNLAGNLFSTCFMALDACKRGFLAGCRPLICLDGCHVKTKFGGQLLTAVGMDPNDCIFPIAMAVVEVESFVSWEWFLETLKSELGIDNTYPWTIMTDKQKGLIPAVKKVFPDSEHRFCVRHLHSNFQEKFKGEILKNQLWCTARSSSVQQFNRNMERMKGLNADAHKWLEKMDPKTWVRAYFSEFPKCDVLLNNNCEVFNKYILEARELPILSMFERIKSQLMTRHYNKQKEAEGFVGNFCPKIRAKVTRNAEFANLCYPLPSGHGVFQVQIREYSHIVDIFAKTCDCRRWQLTGIPCCHAIACLRHERIQPETVLPDCYSIETFKKAYGFSIWPCRDKSEWEHVNGPAVSPPVYEKKVGRPPKSRKKQPHEVQGKNGPKFSKHGVTIHCSHCSEANHNSGGCKLKRMGFTSVEAKKLVANTQAQLQREAEESAQQAAALNPDDQLLQDQMEGDQLHQPVSQVFTQAEIEVPNTEISTTTLLDQMLSQETIATMQSQAIGPLPDSQFIQNNRPVERPQTLTTCTKAGRKATTGTKRKPPAKKTDEGGPKKKSRATRKSGNLGQEGHQEGTSNSYVPSL